MTAKLNGDDDVEVFEIVCRERFMRFPSGTAVRLRMEENFIKRKPFNIVSRWTSS